MGHKEDMPAANQAVDTLFLDGLRQALNHLYDLDQLRSSPLISLFAIEGHFSAGTKLQHILLDAIQAMRPPAAEPASSMRRRIHQVLQLRYEQQFEQKEIAVQLGLSVRQYRRLQHAAVDALAFYLLDRYDLAGYIAAMAPVQPSEANDAAAELPDSLQWITSLPSSETSDVALALPELLRLVEPLATRNHKQITLHSEYTSAIAAVHPLVFRQAMLHVLNSAILHRSGRTVEVTVAVKGRQVLVTARAQGNAALVRTADAGEQPQDHIVQQMLGTCRASLFICDDEETWQSTLTFACAEAPLLLVVDDHIETTDLLQRYLEGTHYRIVVCHNPAQALVAAQANQPLLVLLDVMMPGVDGWEVLTRLKQHEATTLIPVWVCTVLDQSELAFSLGADGFLRKPVTRQSLLAALDAQLPHQEPIRR
jgi:CheY-like chemotaxis protein